MSASLLGDAFKADMGSHVRKLVLLKLVDEARDDGTKIFASMERIATAAEASTRQVRRELRYMEAAKLLRRVANAAGGRGLTLEFELDLEVLKQIGREGFKAVCDAILGEEPLPENADTMSGFPDEEKADIEDTKGGHSLHQKADIGDTTLNPLIEPLKNPLGARGRERSSDGTDDRRFRELVDTFERETRGIVNERRAHFAWDKLPEDARDRAFVRAPVYLTGQRAAKKPTVSLFTFLHDAVFDRVEDPQAGPVKQVEAKARTPEYWLLLFDGTCAGKPMGQKVALTRQHGMGLLVPQDQFPSASTLAALVPIEVGGEAFHAWRRWFSAHSVRISETDPHVCGKFIYLPSEFPPGHDPPETEDRERESEDRQGEGRT